MTSTSIALNMIRGTYLVGTDYAVGTVGNTDVETELLTYDIPANTVTNGIIVSFLASIQVEDSDIDDGFILCEAGTDGSETTYASINFRGNIDLVNGYFPAGDSDNSDNASTKFHNYTFVVDDLDWTAAQTVSIKVKFDSAEGNSEAAAHMLTVLGY